MKRRDPLGAFSEASRAREASASSGAAFDGPGRTEGAAERQPGLAWLALCALLALGACAAYVLLPPAALDIQPDRWLREPWRLWTAAWVHWTPLHLAGNATGAAALALYGWAAGLGRRHALGAFIAWPLTHLLLVLWGMSGLMHYGGLSGVLHAGVALASTALLARRGLHRAVGAAVWAGLLLKLVWESPWGPRLAVPGAAGWDFAVATRAHAAGVLAGLLCALAVEWHERQKNKP